MEHIKDPMDYKHYMTVGDLRKALEGMPDDGKIMVQRVEDVYYEKHHWKTYVKENAYPCPAHYHPAWSAVKYNDEPKHLFIDLHY